MKTRSASFLQFDYLMPLQGLLSKLLLPSCTFFFSEQPCLQTHFLQSLRFIHFMGEEQVVMQLNAHMQEQGDDQKKKVNFVFLLLHHRISHQVFHHLQLLQASFRGFFNDLQMLHQSYYLNILLQSHFEHNFQDCLHFLHLSHLDQILLKALLFIPLYGQVQLSYEFIIIEVIIFIFRDFKEYVSLMLNDLLTFIIQFVSNALFLTSIFQTLFNQ